MHKILLKFKAFSKPEVWEPPVKIRAFSYGDGRDKSPTSQRVRLKNISYTFYQDKKWCWAGCAVMASPVGAIAYAPYRYGRDVRHHYARHGHERHHLHTLALLARLLVGVLKSNYFPTRFRKQNQKRSGSGGTGSLKFSKLFWTYL